MQLAGGGEKLLLLFPTLGQILTIAALWITHFCAEITAKRG
jgi:hypothetical protein